MRGLTHFAKRLNAAVAIALAANHGTTLGRVALILGCWLFVDVLICIVDDLARSGGEDDYA